MLVIINRHFVRNSHLAGFHCHSQYLNYKTRRLECLDICNALFSSGSSYCSRLIAITCQIYGQCLPLVIVIVATTSTTAVGATCRPPLNNIFALYNCHSKRLLLAHTCKHSHIHTHTQTHVIGLLIFTHAVKVAHFLMNMQQ